MGESDGARRLSADQAVALTARVLESVGTPAGIAQLQAAHLVEAELRGHPSHGLRRLPVLVERIEAGLIDPAAVPTFEWTASGSLRVDGNRGLGPVTAYAAIDELAARIPETGVAAAAMRRTHHLGMLAPYAERLADQGCIGVVICSTEGLVHPWGGAGALIGTNPLAVGVPAPGGPVVLDMSTGSVSAGKVLDHLERGKPLPEGWAVDSAGRPTTDAAAAARGAISPFGGAKGYALGLTLGVVVGVLTGTAHGPDVVGTLDSSHETTKGDVIVAFDIAAFGSDATVAQRLADYLTTIRASGVDGAQVTIPGDRARAHRSLALQEGFDVTDEVWRMLSGIREVVDVRTGQSS